MIPYLSDRDLTLYLGDALEVLRELPDGSADCCVTSPPYWNLRDYGTGTWDGGNPECDHKAASTSEPRRFTNGRGEGTDDSYAGSNLRSWTTRDGTTFRDICGKCGAHRVDRQLGLEPTPDAYVATIVAVFREVRRVLAHHGTCWVNLGDSYAGGAGGRGDAGREIPRYSNTGGQSRGASIDGFGDGVRLPRGLGGLKPKDLVGIPWMVAFALRADGWYLRSDIVWSKPNPMPESITDRPTKAHEYVFLLSKRPSYWFDQEAVRESAIYGYSRCDGMFERIGDLSRAPSRVGGERGAVDKGDGTGGRNVRSVWKIPEASALAESGGKEALQASKGAGERQSPPLSASAAVPENYQSEGRPRSDVWEIATQPYPEAHFATFPEALARRCILAGCPEWVCRVCGKPRVRITEIERFDRSNDRLYGGGTIPHPHNPSGKVAGSNTRGMPDPERLLLGWSDCGHNAYRPGVVLDPFGGSGTTALVARNHGRHSILIELNETYAELAARRLSQLSLLAEMI